MTQAVNYKIRLLQTQADLMAARTLFKAYAESLDIDLAYQDFDSELAELPGKYAPPFGALLLAFGEDNEIPIGCVALRGLPDDGVCEMKRLYVSPKARCTGLGRALVDAILKEAQLLGYREMRLDTLPSMGQAINLYKQFGFTSIPPYYETSIEDTLFLGCDLKLLHKASTR